MFGCWMVAAKLYASEALALWQVGERSSQMGLLGPYLTEETEPVATQDFSDIVLIITSFQQLLCNIGEFIGRLYVFGMSREGRVGWYPLLTLVPCHEDVLRKNSMGWS